jgi:adenylate kinase family enzyme
MPNYIAMEQAAEILGQAERVLVIGNPGGGKSTVSAALAERLDLENISMDRDVFWLPGWVLRDRQEQRAILAGMVSGDRWVMDGTGVSSFDLRLPRADLVIWVRVPRLLSLWGVLSRAMKFRGKVRPDMAPACPEQLPDLEFLRYIWTFDQVQTPKVIAAVEEFGPEKPVVAIKSRRDMRRLLALAASNN